jgi:hypothetical protein
MRHEFEYIKDGPGVLRWAIGCILASHRSRLRDMWEARGRPAFRYFVAYGLVVLLVGYALENHAVGRTPPEPTFTEAACDLPNLSPEILPRLRCGTVSVPRDYYNLNAGRFKLETVVVKSAQEPASPDPLGYISGGPGSPLTIYADQRARTLYAAGRDLTERRCPNSLDRR